MIRVEKPAVRTETRNTILHGSKQEMSDLGVSIGIQDICLVALCGQGELPWLHAVKAVVREQRASEAEAWVLSEL